MRRLGWWSFLGRVNGFSMGLIRWRECRLSAVIDTFRLRWEKFRRQVLFLLLSDCNVLKIREEFGGLTRTACESWRDAAGIPSAPAPVLGAALSLCAATPRDSPLSALCPCTSAPKSRDPAVFYVERTLETRPRKSTSSGAIHVDLSLKLAHLECNAEWNEVSFFWV